MRRARSWTQVGEDVAREALARGVELGGKVRDVVALFVDLIGSTALAPRATRGSSSGCSIASSEYTVIGDAVNEAARLTELAKSMPSRLLASEAIISRGDRAEAARRVGDPSRQPRADQGGDPARMRAGPR